MLRIMQVAYTDERGDYRLFWLPPGRYNVAAEVNDPQRRTGPHSIPPPGRAAGSNEAAAPALTGRQLPVIVTPSIV